MTKSENELVEERNMLDLLVDSNINKFHPLVFIGGKPKIGKNVNIGLFSEVHDAYGGEIIIGDNCDIASFVSINSLDSHKKCIGLAEEVERKPIIIENNVFIGSHCFIGGGTKIGHHSVIGAGVVLIDWKIPPYSLILKDSNGRIIRKFRYYKKDVEFVGCEK